MINRIPKIFPLIINSKEYFDYNLHLDILERVYIEDIITQISVFTFFRNISDTIYLCHAYRQIYIEYRIYHVIYCKEP